MVIVCDGDVYTYDGKLLGIIVRICPRTAAAPVRLIATYSTAPLTSRFRAANGLRRAAERMKDIKRVLDHQWGKEGTVFQEDYRQLIMVAQVETAMTWNPER